MKSSRSHRFPFWVLRLLPSWFHSPFCSLSKTQVEVPWLPPNNGRPDPQDRFWRREHCGARLSQIYSLLWENFGRRFSKVFCFPKIFWFIPAATTFVPPIIVCLIALWTFGLKLDTRVFFCKCWLWFFYQWSLQRGHSYPLLFFVCLMKCPIMQCSLSHRISALSLGEMWKEVPEILIGTLAWRSSRWQWFQNKRGFKGVWNIYSISILVVKSKDPEALQALRFHKHSSSRTAALLCS